MSTISPPVKTLADLLDRLGGIPLNRIRFRPSIGGATVQDVIDIERKEGKLCELVEGVLLEKVMGFTESALAVFLASLLNPFVIPRNLERGGHPFPLAQAGDRAVSLWRPRLSESRAGPG